jgi:hypothetical protein
MVDSLLCRKQPRKGAGHFHKGHQASPADQVDNPTAGARASAVAAVIGDKNPAARGRPGRGEWAFRVKNIRIGIRLNPQQLNCNFMQRRGMLSVFLC